MQVKAIAVVVMLILVLGLVPVLTAGVAAEVDAPAVYKAKCRMCHGDSGKGDTAAGKKMLVADLTSSDWKHGKGQAEVEKLIREGSGKMPKYASKLTDDEIVAVAKYFRELCGVDD